MAVDHCYSDIGCFPLSDEFYHPRHRPFNVRPWHRRRINTRFLLFNRHHTDGFMLEPWDRINLVASRFNPLLETKIIIPGWLDSLNRAVWVKRLKDSLLWLWHPVNIIVVHWQNFTPYTIATANTRVVGAELANLLKSIERQLNYDRSYYHLIGHSLGAHIGGYCGDRLPGLGRITALDPARPFFQHMPKSVRLDRGDAKFVDAIHSDFTPENAIFLLMSYGVSTPVGHVDFYPNGHSYLQPGCLRDTLLSVQNGIMRGLEHSSLSLAFLEAIRYLTACDHQRSHEWFLESVTNRQCTFIGVRCNEFEGLINGRCSCDDSPSACAVMGIHADQMYVHNLHEDIWPLGQRGSGRNRDPRNYPGHNKAKPLQQPAFSSVAGLMMTESPPPLLARPESFQLGLHQQIVRPHPAELFEEASREQIHDKLLHEAANLRQAHLPNVVLIDEMYVGLDHMEEDTAFINYLRASLSSAQHRAHSVPIPSPAIFAENTIQQYSQIPLPRPVFQQHRQVAAYGDDVMKRRFDAADSNFKDDVEYIFSGNNAHPLNKHPKLMSDLDRDIENWYEDSSRWFLKTNNKPNYCVNQYQILVYLGPLKTTKGHKHLRANLLVSVIGSRGKLMNQRFIPRSANLDSFTMQPFFVILEGSYTLGNILSVAVGWEARTDPDPIQATISFQSSLLEDVQASLPAPPRLRPILGETMKYDHSDGFRWRPQIKPRLEKRLSSPARGFSRRTSLMIDDAHHQLTATNAKCLIEDEETGQCTISHSDIMHEAKSEEQARLMTQLLLAENQQIDATDHKINNNNKDDEQRINDEDEDGSKILAGAADLNSAKENHNPELEAAIAAEKVGMANLADFNAYQSERAGSLAAASSRLHHREIRHHGANQIPYGWPLQRPLVPHHEESRIAAEFHNVPHLHHLENSLEDSIVINQIVVNPLQANYGKADKPGKVFCPARPGQRLRRDQTIKLLPNLLGRCQVNNHHRFG